MESLLSDGRVVTTEDKVNNIKIAKKIVKADIHIKQETLGSYFLTIT